jgi:hypothetical protein
MDLDEQLSRRSKKMLPFMLFPSKRPAHGGLPERDRANQWGGAEAMSAAPGMLE